jgi:hypothetical protein
VLGPEDPGKILVQPLNTTDELSVTADHVHYPNCQRRPTDGEEECPFLANDYHRSEWQAAAAATPVDVPTVDAGYVGCVV